MKTKVVTETAGFSLPEVGEAWKHASRQEVFVRINDKEGRNALNIGTAMGNIFSVSLSDGQIYRTIPPFTDIVLLEPVGGVAKFQQKGDTHE